MLRTAFLSRTVGWLLLGLNLGSILAVALSGAPPWLVVVSVLWNGGTACSIAYALGETR